MTRLQLVKAMANRDPELLTANLRHYPTHILEKLVQGGISIYALEPGERFTDASPEVSRIIPDFDSWPSIPAGLFVLGERRVILKQVNPMTVCHEVAHALDCVLANKRPSYFSFECKAIRQEFVTAEQFVNEYAASGLDEFFAESVRAYLEANSPASKWKPLKRETLQLYNPGMFNIVKQIIETGSYDEAA